MTPQQFTNGLEKLGLTKAGFARLIRTDERSVFRYASGERAVSPQVALLMELLLAGKLKISDIEKMEVAT